MRVLEFLPALEPITTPVTKFGGQPVWLCGSQWPRSRGTGGAMRFVCQVALPESARAGGQRMAYVFYTDPEPGEEFVDGTWDPEGGENAVVLQPGAFTPVVECGPLERGPSLMAWEERPRTVVERLRGLRPRVRRPVECSAREVEASGEGVETRTRLGGEPAWLQNDETPAGGPWKFVLQIDSTYGGFDLNFGDSGVGYVFVREDGGAARFLWQCG